MIKLGKQTQYALVALLHLGRIAPGTRASTREIAERYGIPEPHLGKVLQKLSRAGLLSAEKGSQGGYEIGRPLNRLRLGDVMQALNPRERDVREAPRSLLSAFPSCYLRDVVREVEHRAVSHMEVLSLSELLAGLEIPEPMELGA